MENVEALYREHFTGIHRWFRRETGNTDEASDLAQDVFLKLSLREGEGLETSASYMWATAKNHLIDWKRKQSSTPQHISLDEVKTGQSGAINKIPRTPRDS